jgi:ATP-dependent helicase/nuclease subunit A
MNQTAPMSDRDARRAAETTFDRNVVVVAGAGTGKTTLLVNRMVHLLMREPQPVSIMQTVALTYTNKAATEMKIRLRERLMGLARSSTEPVEAADAGIVALEDLRAQYAVTADDVATRAAAALQDIEKAQIGTVHSFAAHLLRLHPLEAGLDPAFREDDGLRFDEAFRTAWDIWIDRELGREGIQHRRWRALLESTTLDQVRGVAYALSSDLVDVEVLCRQVSAEPDQTLRDWIGTIQDRAEKLLNIYDRPKRRKIEWMLAGAVAFMTLVRQTGSEAVHQLEPSAREWLDKDPGQILGDWEAHDFLQAKTIVTVAKQFRSWRQSRLRSRKPAGFRSMAYWPAHGGCCGTILTSVNTSSGNIAPS